MGYTDTDTSTQDGSVVELYEFRQGSNFWRYTSASQDIDKATKIFTAEYITRNEIKQTGDITRGVISLGFPRSNEFASLFLGFAPEGVTTLTIFRGHITDTSHEYISYWKGRVLKASATKDEITLSCESVFTSLRQLGLREHYERNCRHALYSAGCSLSMSSFKVDSVVTAVDGTTLTIAGASAYPDGTFVGGVLKNSLGESRLVTSHVGTTIKVNRVYETSPGGDSVQLYPGCDKLKTTCITKFNNLANFGGFPYVPDNSPFGGKSII